jgi:hypothetical protein
MWLFTNNLGYRKNMPARTPALPGGSAILGGKYKSTMNDCNLILVEQTMA